ncbi:hypothetical protein NKH77_40065 [Streptomyces sp. M19]
MGHRPRPGVAAGTLLAYRLDRDPRAETGTPVLIRAGRSATACPPPPARTRGPSRPART